MSRLRAAAKINLALVVGPLGPAGRHEVATVMQRVALADEIELSPAPGLEVAGFDGDTIVTAALQALAAAAQVSPAWSVEITKRIPVAAGLGGGSSDAAAALMLANDLLPEPLAAQPLAELAATIGADVPFFLGPGTKLASGDGSTLAPARVPQDFFVVLLLPNDVAKASTAEVYRAFDERDGAAGFEERRAALLEALADVRTAADLARLPPNDLARSPLAERLGEAGAFRADVSGAGPCVYGLFLDRERAGVAAASLERFGRAWVTTPI